MALHMFSMTILALSILMVKKSTNIKLTRRETMVAYKKSIFLFMSPFVIDCVPVTVTNADE